MKKIRVFGLVFAVTALAAFLVSCSDPSGAGVNNRGDVTIGLYFPNNDPTEVPVVRVLSAPRGLTASVASPFPGVPTHVTTFGGNDDQAAPMPLSPLWVITLSPRALVGDIISQLPPHYTVGERVRLLNSYTVTISWNFGP